MEEVQRTALRDAQINMAAGTGIEAHWIDVEGLRIYCRYSEGTGPGIVVLPGGMIDSTLLTWKYVLEALPPHCRVFVPDLPGYGASDKPDVPYTTDYYIGFLERFLEAVGLERASLFGSSMSGAIVLGFALRQPERVARLVLSGAFGLQPRVPLHEAAYLAARLPGIDVVVRWLLQRHPLMVRLALPIAVYHWHAITDELVADAYAGVQAPNILTAFKRWMCHDIQPHHVRSNFTEQLPQLQMPVLLLHGRYDWMMPVRYARRAARLLPNAQLYVFDAGHLVPREYPDEVNDLIRAFISQAA